MNLKTVGSSRDSLKGENREDLISQQVLVGDPRRWRPRWFDGRFLAASDLQAEQNYFLTRQADICRAGGSGVIDGLWVSEVAGVEQLRIEPGQGVTDKGELLVLFSELKVNPSDVAQMQRLDGAFGLQMIPQETGLARTGLYVLALRPVEWTANPISAYPTSLTGTRTVQDGTIIEGVAVSLIPYPDKGNDDTWNRRRARVAREIFVEGRDYGMNSGVLPLAMVALRGNLIEWVDPFMVRRETGSERPAGTDFGFGSRALREAHLLQYQLHLADVLNANKGAPFLANAYLDALPPAGQFPSATLDPDLLTQRFFPAGIEVEVSFIPDDELPAVIEESLLVPPIDLTVGPEGLSGIVVIVLVPLSRADFAEKRRVLPNWDDNLPQLRPVFKEITARTSPRELLLSRFFRSLAPPAQPPEEQPWRTLLRNAQTQQLLWYVRRRHLPIPANIAGTPVSADSFTDLVLDDTDFKERLEVLRRLESPEVNLFVRRFTEKRFADIPHLLRSIVARASGTKETKPTAESAVLALAALVDPKLGQGLALIDQKKALAKALRSNPVVDSGTLADLDRLAREVPEDRFSEFLGELPAALKEASAITEKLAALRREFVERS
ncbi:MAG TPA: hypothetical protein VE422_45820 [Terriglobia bacterium]|nr:hypothetical protein [Terriglobia bacterium]